MNVGMYVVRLIIRQFVDYISTNRRSTNRGSLLFSCTRVTINQVIQYLQDCRIIVHMLQTASMLMATKKEV